MPFSHPEISSEIPSDVRKHVPDHMLLSSIINTFNTEWTLQSIVLGRLKSSVGVKWLIWEFFRLTFASFVNLQNACYKALICNV